jgi:hypothetical protein
MGQVSKCHIFSLLSAAYYNLKAYTSHKQIADLASLREGMHKFEAHYIDNLVGKELCTNLYGDIWLFGFVHDWINNIT